MTDQPLGTPTPDEHTQTHQIEFPPNTPRTFTVEDVLANAKLPERTAQVCLRPDLQADYDAALTELATLVNAQGEIIADPEATLGDESRVGRAQELGDIIAEVRKEMAAHMWSVRFRGLASEDYSVFNKQHQPKGENPDTTEYNLHLIAATAFDPPISYEQAKALNAKLGARAMTELSNTAWNTCNDGGISVPKSLTFSVNQARN